MPFNTGDVGWARASSPASSLYGLGAPTRNGPLDLDGRRPCCVARKNTNARIRLGFDPRARAISPSNNNCWPFLP